MNIFSTNKKTIKANGNGFVMPNYKGDNSVTFFAVLPKSAVVDRIKVDGVFLEDVTTKKIRYNHGITEKLAEEEYKAVATVEFEDYDLELYDKLANYTETEFEVYYHLEAVIEE